LILLSLFDLFDRLSLCCLFDLLSLFDPFRRLSQCCLLSQLSLLSLCCL
jgi:hypothetical protein